MKISASTIGRATTAWFTQIVPWEPNPCSFRIANIWDHMLLIQRRQINILYYRQYARHCLSVKYDIPAHLERRVKVIRRHSTTEEYTIGTHAKFYIESYPKFAHIHSFPLI
jgi:hypothetical protein